MGDSWNFSDSEILDYGGHGGLHRGSIAQMSMRYSDKIGVIYFRNQHAGFLFRFFKHINEKTRNANKAIHKTLFEKADEL